MTQVAANDRFAPGVVVDLAAKRRAKADAEAASQSTDYGYLLTYCGKRRELTNLATGRKLCALVG